jgi:hypothetical protein
MLLCGAKGQFNAFAFAPENKKIAGDGRRELSTWRFAGKLIRVRPDRQLPCPC